MTSMVVQWKFPIGARVCDVVAGSNTDRACRAADDRVTVIAGCDIAVRRTVGPETRQLILSADNAFLYALGHDGSVRIISTADHKVTTISGSPSPASQPPAWMAKPFTNHSRETMP